MAARRIADAVSWFEGMRLAPQHFQQQDMRSAQLAAALRLAGPPFAWGLVAMSGDDQGRMGQADRIVVTSLQAIMPDGQYVELEQGAAPLVFDWASAAPGQDELVQVSLACTRQAASLHDALPGTEPRTVDVHNPDPGVAPGKLHVQRAQLQLVGGVPGGMAAQDLLPLFRLRRRGAGDFVVADYTPPTLALARGAPLNLRLQRLGSQLREAYRTLRTRCEGAHPDLAQRPWMLPHLGAHLMELEAHDNGLLAHPFQVYQQLCALLGAVAGGDTRQRVPSAARFNYNDLNECMLPLIASIETCLYQFAPEYQEVRFTYQAGEGYSAALAAIPGAAQYYLGLQAPARASAQDMAGWIDDATIGQAHQFASLIRLRSSGVAARLVPDDTARQIGRPDLVLFALDGIGHAYPAFTPQDGMLRILGPSGSEHTVAPQQLVLLGKAATDGGSQA